MQFILTANRNDAISALAKRLIHELTEGQLVLWLVSGGSNAMAAVKTMDQIPDDLSRKLSVMPVDERYGAPGHKDSNWSQLLQANFPAKQARLIPVLEAGLNFEQNIESYSQLVAQAFANHHTVVGLLGIGEDGHIAGILPNSAACQADSDLVAGYEALPLKRMTLTFPALKRLTAAYTFVFGANKLPALRQLKSQALPLKVQPAQILKTLPEAYVYNDQLGEDA